MDVVHDCVAHYTQRPLLSLTINGIGTEAATSKNKIDFYFERAKLWDPMLLTDEADIPMERRDNQDLQELVSFPVCQP